MSGFAWLTVYCSAILLVSLVGGCVPFLGRVTHARLQFYLSVSAGVMLGASFFHVMPDAMEAAGAAFGWWMALGVVGIFGVERFIAPHSHEADGRGAAKHEHGPGCEHHHGPAAAPAVAGWMAVLGLTLHTFMNGVGLAGAVHLEATRGADAGAGPAVALPGLALFLAIVLHKPADALAISTVLTRKGVGLRPVALVQLGFALMVPLGAVAFQLTAGAIAEDLEGQLTGAALAFSAGTFLFIALSDLLPEVQFHRHDRIPLFLALVLGVALMGGIALLEGHRHGEHEHAPAAGRAGAGDHPHAKDHHD
jgi:zinc and cadmium transporter